MDLIIEAIIEGCRRASGVAPDRASARLALLVVIDHLDRALCRDELAELAEALPLGLGIMVQRRRGYDRAAMDLVEPDRVEIVCEVLAGLAVGSGLQWRLRERVPALLADEPDRTTRRRPVHMPRPDERPTLRVVKQQLRPTLVVRNDPRPTQRVLASV